MGQPTAWTPLSVRTTHVYDWGWTHADQSKTIGQIKVLQPQLVEQGNGIDYEGTYQRLVVVSPGTRKSLAKEAIVETLMPGFNSSCSHEYDCCGCRHASMTVRHVKGRTFSVRTHHYRNY